MCTYCTTAAAELSVELLSNGLFVLRETWRSSNVIRSESHLMKVIKCTGFMLVRNTSNKMPFIAAPLRDQSV